MVAHRQVARRDNIDADNFDLMSDFSARWDKSGVPHLWDEEPHPPPPPRVRLQFIHILGI
jgi:hypothetical protein